MEDRIILCYELPCRGADAGRKIFLPYPFHLLNVTPPDSPDGVNNSSREPDERILSQEEGEKYACTYPPTSMPPEPQGYMKVNKYDLY